MQGCILKKPQAGHDGNLLRALPQKGRRDFRDSLRLPQAAAMIMAIRQRLRPIQMLTAQGIRLRFHPESDFGLAPINKTLRNYLFTNDTSVRLNFLYGDFVPQSHIIGN
jgi:hypothetical protein